MLWPAPDNKGVLTALAGGCIFLNFLYFLQKKTLNSPTAGVYWEFFSAFYNYLRLCVAFWQSAFWKSCVSPAGPLPFPVGFPGCTWFCLPFCILYINYYSLFLLFYFCSGEDFSQYFMLFSYTFTYYRRFLENFLFRIKLAIQKGEFLFFSSVVRKFLSISLFLLCPLFFVTALSPAPPEKPRTDFFTAQHFSLISAEENSHFAVCFASSRLHTASFFLPNWEFYSGKISRRELSAQQNIFLFSWEENSFFTRIFLSIQQKKTRNLLIIYKEINL